MQVLKKEDWSSGLATPRTDQIAHPLVVEYRVPPGGAMTQGGEPIEIVLIAKGRGHLRDDDQSYPLSAGDVFVIDRAAGGSIVNEDGLLVIAIVVEVDELKASLTELQTLSGYHAFGKLEPLWRKRHQFSSHLRLNAQQLVQAISGVDAIEKELIRGGPNCRAAATERLVRWIALLSSCYWHATDPHSRSLLKIASTVSHIQRHYAQSIALEQLIEMAGMSRRSYLRVFEQSMGHPPIAYLIRQRIRHACRMLQSDELSIAEIAVAVGFSDGNYFSRQFRSLMGCCPSEYRQRVRVG